MYGPGTLNWLKWSEIVPSAEGELIIASSPLEQLNVTQDQTEYMFYTTNGLNISTGSTLTFMGWHANTYSVFIDGVLTATAQDIEHAGGQLSQTVTLPSTLSGTHSLTILSGSLGIHAGINNQQPGTAQEKKGIVGNVSLNAIDITLREWIHRPFLTGEILQVFTAEGTNSVTWTPVVGTGVATPLTWYKTTFARPQQQGGVIKLNVNGASRGHFYLNGVDMGRSDSL